MQKQFKNLGYKINIEQLQDIKTVKKNNNLRVINIKLNFKYEQFAKQIIKNSKVKLIMINNENELKKYVTQNIYGKNIVIGMGAGSVSQWMRNLPNKL